MAEIKKYLDTQALGTLVDQIKNEDAKGLQSAKDYADSLAKNYDSVGSAASALVDAKTYTDALANGQVATNKANIESIQSDYLKTADKTALQESIDAVDTKVDKNAEDIVAINDTENGILAQAKNYTDTEVAGVQDSVNGVAGYVGTFTHDTAQTVVEYIDAKTNGIATSDNLEALNSRVTVVEGDVAAIKGDYLKEADKTELEGKITNVQTAVDNEKSRAEGVESGLRTDVDAIKNDYLKGEDKTELVNAINAEKERAEGVEGGLDTRVKAIEEDYLTSSDKDALQTQINTIVNNPDTEGVINSINEFTQYIAEHGEIAEGFRTDIDKNKEDIAANAKAISDHEALAAETYATKTELADEKKALQDEIDADVKVVADRVTTLEGAVSTKVEQSVYEAKVLELVGVDSDLDERIAVLEGQLGESGSVVEDIATAKQEAIDAAALDATTKANAAESNAKTYADGLNTAMDTRVAAVEAKAHEHANKSELDLIVSGDKAKWDAAADKAHEHANSTELAKIVDGDVAKWNAAEGNAKTYADGLNTAMTTKVDGIDGRVGALETTIVDKAEQDDLDNAVTRIEKNEADIASLTSSVNSFTSITSEEIEAMFA